MNAPYQYHKRNLSRNFYKTNTQSKKRMAYQTQLGCQEIEEHDNYIANKLNLIKLNIQKKFQVSVVNKEYCFPRKIDEDEEPTNDGIFSPIQRVSIYANPNLMFRFKCQRAVKAKANSRNISETMDRSGDSSKSRVIDLSNCKMLNNSMVRNHDMPPMMNKRKLVFHKKLLTRLVFPVSYY